MGQLMQIRLPPFQDCLNLHILLAHLCISPLGILCTWYLCRSLELVPAYLRTAAFWQIKLAKVPTALFTWSLPVSIASLHSVPSAVSDTFSVLYFLARAHLGATLLCC